MGIVVLESLSVFSGSLDCLEQILKQERKRSVCSLFLFFLLFLMGTLDKNMGDHRRHVFFPGFPGKLVQMTTYQLKIYGPQRGINLHVCRRYL